MKRKPEDSYCATDSPDCLDYQFRAEIVRLQADNERLRAAAAGIDMLLLVIESAVRNSDPSQHRAALNALQANRAALKDTTP